jgi:hypothetical protein
VTETYPDDGEANKKDLDILRRIFFKIYHSNNCVFSNEMLKIKRCKRRKKRVSFSSFIQFSSSYEGYESTSSELENNNKNLEKTKIEKIKYC